MPTRLHREAIPRVAASSYLNTAPLIWSFVATGPQRNDVRLLTDAAPARCADLLVEGKVEAALVPVVEYQRMPGLMVVPDVCVGARAQVRSVVLVTRGIGIEKVRSIALDTSSRTSAALIKIIFHEYLQREPRFTPASPDLRAMLQEHDAALLIGDPGMTFPRTDLRVYDMAALWREHTGLGFVFAMWMARKENVDHVRAIDFAGARDEGLAHAEEIAASYSDELGLARAELLTYLRENICYAMDGEMHAGLELFYQLAYKHGTTEAVRPLELI